MIYIIVAALVFLICFGLDKGFTRLFRSKPQHFSGQSVRLSKYYAIAGIIMFVLGVAGIFSSQLSDWVLLIGSCLIVLLGIGLCVYYLAFGIYYDADSFLVCGIFKKSTAYRYSDILGQMLYKSYGNIIIVELHTKGGKTVQVLSGMTGADAFLDAAYQNWLRQTGRNAEDCTFHDPANSLWFPPVED